jgi:NAD-dependent SIR2 family protein deacetylase
MSPDAPCPRCGKIVAFHEDEMDDLEDGIAVCPACGLEIEYAVFFGEVLGGKHPELIERLKEQLEDEGREG